jgi:hypothetical protein
MPLLKVQLNHPGEQKPFIIGSGYQSFNNLIIREWNNDPKHYRKFIKNSGDYLQNLNSKPQKNSLLFWGEWEGNSEFTPFAGGIGFPNGTHVPFHSILIRGIQNTDPYVFGKYFKYAICSQTGLMCNLLADSLILFGTTKDIGFELDTVFVVRNHESAQNVYLNNASNYTLIYREETLEQLGQTYLGPNPSLNNKIHRGQTWWENKDYFSFVPCKVDNGLSFKKVVLQIPPMGKQKVGHPYHHFDNINHIQLWKLIVKEVLKQGFYLGIRFNEPQINNAILNGFNHHQPKTISPCNGNNRLSGRKSGCK